MKKSIFISLAVVAIALIFNGCGANKQILIPSGRAVLNKKAFLSAYGAMKEYPIVDANGKATLITHGNKDISIGNIGIRWSLERDHAFVLSVRPMAIMEIGRLTVTGEKMMVVDKVGRHVFLEEDLGSSALFLRNVVGINTDIFKAMVQNEPFGLIGTGAESLGRMDFKKDGKYYTLTDGLRPGGHRIIHTFDAALNLIETQMTIVDKAEVKITYRDFVRMDSDLNYRPVPSVVRIDIETKEKPYDHYHLQINLERMRQNFSQKIDTDLPKGYKRVTLLELIELISSI